MQPIRLNNLDVNHRSPHVTERAEPYQDLGLRLTGINP